MRRAKAASKRTSARVEYAFATHLHVGAEVTAHLMLPSTPFDVDATLFTGVHF